MKNKFVKATALALAATLCMTGCGGNGNSNANSNSSASNSKSNAGDKSSSASSSSSSSASSSSSSAASSSSSEQDEDSLYPAYDLGGVTLTILNQSDVTNHDPNAENLEDYQKAERQEHWDYIEKKYNVKLELVPVPTDNWDEMPAEIVSAYTSGHPVADIMDTYYQFIDTFTANDILVDMSAELKKADMFNPNAYFTWIGKQWGISSGISGEGLYYNKTWIEDLGMEYTPAEMFDMGKWDYDNCYNYLKEMKSKMAEDEYPMFVAPYYWALWATHANGTKIWQDNGNLGYIEEPFLECYEFLQKLVNDGLVAVPTPNEEGRYDTWGYPAATFDAGEKVAIAHRAAWQAAGLVDKFELGYVPYPWGSNVSLDESKIGESGAYKTLDSNYMGSYYDGQAIVLTKGIEQKAEPIAVMAMMAEFMGWDFAMKDYVPEEGSRDCGWLEEGIDEDLYFFQMDRHTCEFFNSIGGVDFQASFTGTIYRNESVRSNFESAYQADMKAMIEAGYATEDVMTPVE